VRCRFPESSLDLVVLPHTLELSRDPHATLREVSRVLVPEGRVVISGLNPTSLWGLRQRRGHLYQRWGYDNLFLPKTGEFIGYWRLRDWLRLLDFEVESGRFGCYRPALTSQAWLDRFEWMDAAGDALVADLRRRVFSRGGQARAGCAAAGARLEDAQGPGCGAGRGGQQGAGRPLAAAGLSFFFFFHRRALAIGPGVFTSQHNA
jgi:SAM-dependent methyltransferase